MRVSVLQMDQACLLTLPYLPKSSSRYLTSIDLANPLTCRLLPTLVAPASSGLSSILINLQTHVIGKPNAPATVIAAAVSGRASGPVPPRTAAAVFAAVSVAVACLPYC